MSKSQRRRADALDIGLLVLRLAVGSTLFAHGTQKLAGWFGGHGIAGATAGMENMGFAHPKLSAVLAGVSETAGGLVALGAGTRVTSAAGAAAMVAAADVHRPNGFFAQNGGFEYPALLGAASVALVFTGPGRFSMDRVLGNPFDDERVGVAALIGSMAGAAVVLQRRNNPSTATG